MKRIYVLKRQDGLFLSASLGNKFNWSSVQPMCFATIDDAKLCVKKYTGEHELKIIKLVEMNPNETLFDLAKSIVETVKAETYRGVTKEDLIFAVVCVLEKC